MTIECYLKKKLNPEKINELIIFAHEQKCKPIFHEEYDIAVRCYSLKQYFAVRKKIKKLSKD